MTSCFELPFNSECHFWKYGLLQKELQNKNWYLLFWCECSCWKVCTRYIFLSFTMNCHNLRIEWFIMQHYSKYWKNMTCQKQHLKFNNLRITGCWMMLHVWEEVLPSSSKDKFWKFNLKSPECWKASSCLCKMWGVMVSSRILISTQLLENRPSSWKPFLFPTEDLPQLLCKISFNLNKLL